MSKIRRKSSNGSYAAEYEMPSQRSQLKRVRPVVLHPEFNMYPYICDLKKYKKDSYAYRLKFLMPKGSRGRHPKGTNLYFKPATSLEKRTAVAEQRMLASLRARIKETDRLNMQLAAGVPPDTKRKGFARYSEKKEQYELYVTPTEQGFINDGGPFKLSARSPEEVKGSHIPKPPYNPPDPSVDNTPVPVLGHKPKDSLGTLNNIYIYNSSICTSTGDTLPNTVHNTLEKDNPKPKRTEGVEGEDSPGEDTDEFLEEDILPPVPLSALEKKEDISSPASVPAPEEEGEKHIVFFPEQSQAYMAEERFVSLVAGTGGGKTFLGPPWLYREIARHPGESWLVVAPTYKLLTRVTLPALTSFFRGTDAEGVWSEKHQTYTLPDGSIIYCLTAERPELLEGGQFKGAWLDEAGQMKYMVWLVVQARVGLKQGRILITTTPYAKNWLYNDVAKKALEGNHHYFLVQYSSVNNPHYPMEEYERARESMDPRIFDMRYNGQFTQMEGLVYPEYEQAVCAPFIIPPEWPRYGGIDWGFSDYFAGLCSALSPEGILYIYRERCVRRATIKEHALALKDWNFDSIRPARFFCDPSGAQEIADIRQERIIAEKADNSITYGISIVTEGIRRGTLKIFPDLVFTLDEFATYRYPHLGDFEKACEKPLDENNHAMDALRYLIVGVRQARGQRLMIHTANSKDDNKIVSLEELRAARDRAFTRMFNGDEGWASLS